MEKLLRFLKPKEMDFLNDPISKLIKNISIPASLGMFFNSMFNFTDTYFAGNILGKNWLGALTASFPLFFIFLALGSGIGTGVNVLISTSLGSGDEKKAKEYAGNGIVFAFLFSLFLTIVAFLVMPFLVKIVSTEDFYAGTLQYMNVLTMGIVFFIVTGVYNSILQSQGDTISFTKILLITVVINIILDPLFLGVGGILPNFGTAGVAIATVISQMITFVYLYIKVNKIDLVKNLKKSDYKMKSENIREILRQGIPASLNMATMVMGMFVIMNAIKRLGNSDVLAGYGPAMRIEQLALLPTLGFSVAAMTLVGRNYGAGNIQRVKQIYNKILQYGLVITLLGTIFSIIFGKQLFLIFTKDADVMREGLKYLYIDAWVYFAYVLISVSIAVLQGLKKPNLGMYVGAYRQFIAPMILIFILGQLLNMREIGIWWAIFIATWSAALFTYLYTKKVIKTIEQNSLN